MRTEAERTVAGQRVSPVIPSARLSNAPGVSDLSRRDGRLLGRYLFFLSLSFLFSFLFFSFFFSFFLSQNEVTFMEKGYLRGLFFFFFFCLEVNGVALVSFGVAFY